MFFAFSARTIRISISNEDIPLHPYFMKQICVCFSAEHLVYVFQYVLPKQMRQSVAKEHIFCLKKKYTLGYGETIKYP